jgi:hypothetical protein
MKIRVPLVAALIALQVTGAGNALAKGGGGGGGNPPPPPPPPTTTNPSAPALLSPAAGASVLQPVTMSWAASTGTTPIVAYNWAVSSTSTFSVPVRTGFTAASSTSSVIPLSAVLTGLSPGTYFWRVDAVRDFDSPNVGLITGPWSAVRSMVITGSAPSTLPAPVMTGPPDGFRYHPYETVHNAWQPVPGAHHYLLEYDNEPTFTLPLFNADFSPIPADVTIAPLMFGEPVGNLWFRVVAVAADGTRSLPSNVRMVTISFIAPIPPAPLLVGPPDGSPAQVPFVLDWADDANPQSYELQIGQDPTFAAANAAECTGVDWCVRGIPVSQWTVPNLIPGVKYWRVRSEHGDISPTEPALSAWSAVRSVVVGATPPRIQQFRLDVLTDNGLTVSSHTDAFSGTTLDNQVFGHLELDPFIPVAGQVVTLTSSDPTVASVPPTYTVPHQQGLDATASIGNFPIDPKPVSVAQTVTITASLPTGSMSQTLTVHPRVIPPPPPPPVLTAPDQINPVSGFRSRPGANLTFSWMPVLGATSYELQVDDSSAFTLPLSFSRTTPDTAAGTSTLAKTTFWWRVRATTGSTTGPWSTVRSFFVN